MTTTRIGKYIPDWIWWILFAFFGIFFLIGIWIVVDALVFFAGAQKTRGEVVLVSRDLGNTEGISYFATIRYRRDDGQISEGRTHISLGTYNYAIGQQVDIFYSRDWPEEVRIDSFISILFPSLFFLLFGGLFIVLVVWVRAKVRYSVVTSWDGDSVVFRIRDEETKLRARMQPEQQIEPHGEHETSDPSQRDHVRNPSPVISPAIKRGR